MPENRTKSVLCSWLLVLRIQSRGNKAALMAVLPCFCSLCCASPLDLLLRFHDCPGAARSRRRECWFGVSGRSGTEESCCCFLQRTNRRVGDVQCRKLVLFGPSPSLFCSVCSFPRQKSDLHDKKAGQGPMLLHFPFQTARRPIHVNYSTKHSRTD